MIDHLRLTQDRRAVTAAGGRRVLLRRADGID
jgi:hypothetical protein